MLDSYRRARQFVGGSWAQFVGLALCLAILLAGGLTLNGCSSRDPFAGKGSPMYPGSGPLPKGGGRYHVGKPYEIAGTRFHPREDPDYDKVGIASWYGPKFHRRMTANGEWFDQDYLSAAHPTLPLPSYARVTNLENGRQVVVRVNDRGPFVADRIIDLSKKSADILGVRGRGTAKVRVQYLGPAPLNDNGTHLASMNRHIKDGSPAPVLTAARQAPERASGGSPEIAAADGEGRVYVQVGAFSDPSNAGRAKTNVASVGPVVITPVEVGSSRLYRVRVGPLTSQSLARAALAQVHAAGHRDARLVVTGN